MTHPETISGEKRDAIVTMLSRRPAVSLARIADFHGISIHTMRGIARANGFTSLGRPK